MSSRPWYKWFPGDYLIDTCHLSNHADLLYRRLLDAHWVHGSIPADLEAIRRLARFERADFDPAWEAVKGYFVNRGGRNPRLVNKRMESLIGLCSREKGRKRDAANARWNKDLRANAMQVQCDPDPDPDIREEKRGKSAFRPPPLEEVEQYCLERGKGVDSDRWWDFYQSKGWMVGKNRMKDWKAAVRTWERGAAKGPGRQADKEVSARPELKVIDVPQAWLDKYNKRHGRS